MEAGPLVALLGRTLAELARAAGRQAAAEAEAGELRGELDETNRGLLALYAELSDQKQKLEVARAEAEEASRAKSTFLATMSHEIRSPLNAVIGFTALLLDTSLTAEQSEYAHAVRAAGSHLHSMIDDVLDTAKIEAGRLELEAITFDLIGCVEDAVAIVWPAAAAKGLPLGALFAPDTPATVVGDPVRLRQILVNLLSNAVKFTTDGQISVEVVPEPPTDRAQPVTFHVRDTGIGIAPDTLDRLFAPFTQADASTTRRFGGTGLGLFICRQLAERMGGGIAVTSTLGSGSTFVCTVRLGLAEPARPEPALDGVRVLVAVDQPLLAEVIARHLRSWRAHLDCAASVPAGPGAVDLVIAGGPPPPGLAAAGVPVVAIVAPGADRSTLTGTDGVRAAVTTPVRRSRLYEAVGAALGRPGAAEVAEPAAKHLR